jgi:hydrogenase expression/formation protein HypC
MCLGIPGKIRAIHNTDLLRQGTVDFDGVTREVCLACVPEASVGDYVIVHVGFAISRLDEEEARLTLDALRRSGDLDAELGEVGEGEANPASREGQV